MTSFVLMACGECGIQFQVPESFYDERVRRGPELGWYCPNGHRRIFKEPEADKLRRERDRLVQQLAEKDDAIAERDRRLVAAKGQMTKLQKRVSAGVCPCCTRSFTNLRRHIATKHPDYGAENVVQFKAESA